MIRSKWMFVFAIILLSFTAAGAQNNANSILRAVYNKLQKAKDYSVNANIKVDMPFIRMVPVDVKIYYKQKGKFKVESKSIAVVPRQGFDQAAEMLADTNSFTAIIQGEEKMGAIQTSIVNVIPISDTGDVILGKFWIDPLQYVIIKSQLTTRSNGTIVTDCTYGSQVLYGLPDKMIFSVDTKKFKMPKNISQDTDKNSAGENNNGKENKKGMISVVLTNYKVNAGIPDGFFEK